MIRKALIAVSMLAAIVTLALAAVSVFATLRWDTWRSTREVFGVQLRHGSVLLCTWRLKGDLELGAGALQGPRRWGHISASPLNSLRWWQFVRNATTYEQVYAVVIGIPPLRSYKVHCSAIAFPLWAPFALFSSYPVVVGLRHLRRKRTRPGHCRHCGYDLTGNVTGVCPECGERI